MTRRREIWDLRDQEVRDFCAAAALYAEAIEHREGPDGCVRFMGRVFGMTEASARDVIEVGRSIVGRVSVPRAEWDDARASVALPLMDRMEARLKARRRS